MTREKEVLRMALEALKQWNTPLYKRATVIAAIEEVLAQPEQEPDIWGCRFNKGNRLDTFYTKSAAERYVEGALRNGADVSLVGLYTTPPQRMTDEGIKKLLEFYYRFGFTKASETTHKIRGLQDYTVCITDGLEDTSKPHTEIAPRTWVGLTDDEIDVIDEATWDEDDRSWGIHDFARAIETKLKEKIMDRQCSSCGGICKQSGCERENVATNDTSKERVDETEKDRHEPVAWMRDDEQYGFCFTPHPPSPFQSKRWKWTPLYTHPPQSFTYEQVKAHIQVALLSSQPVVKESLTTEPVAWINFCGFTGEMTVDFDCESELASIPLYKKEQL